MPVKAIHRRSLKAKTRKIRRRRWKTLSNLHQTRTTRTSLKTFLNLKRSDLPCKQRNKPKKRSRHKFKLSQKRLRSLRKNLSLIKIKRVPSKTHMKLLMMTRLVPKK